MDEILSKLATIKSDIRCDIFAEWSDSRDKLNWTIQLSKIENAIALLESIGDNPNINKD